MSCSEKKYFYSKNSDTLSIKKKLRPSQIVPILKVTGVLLNILIEKCVEACEIDWKSARELVFDLVTVLLSSHPYINKLKAAVSIIPNAQWNIIKMNVQKIFLRNCPSQNIFQLIY